VTACPSEPKLPWWRLLTGLSIPAILIAVAIQAGLVYLDDYRLDTYMRSLAGQPALSDRELTGRILARAQELGLSLQPWDIAIAHPSGKTHIRIEKFTVQTNLVKLDLRLPAADSR
jgi:hypothetical protein